MKNISKFSLGLFSGILLSSLVFSTFAIAGSPIKLIINGKEINCTVPPQIINGKTMVSARDVAENLGATVTWDSSNNSVIVTDKILNSNGGGSEANKPISAIPPNPNATLNPEFTNEALSKKAEAIINKNSSVISVNTTTTPVPTSTTPIVNTSVQSSTTQGIVVTNMSETTYETIPNSDDKLAYVTFTMNNPTNKYLTFLKVTPIVNINDGRTFGCSLDGGNQQLKDSYVPPNTTVTLTYWCEIPKAASILKFEY